MQLGLLECKCCGAPLTPTPEAMKERIIRCVHCGHTMTLAKEDEGKTVDLLRSAELLLDTCRFDEAYTAYEKAAELDENEPEAYFGMALARFKVQYLKDEASDPPRMQPICHEISEKQFSDDTNYLRALRVANIPQKRAYREKAGEIDEIRDRFYALRDEGLTYDCFLCVKVSEDGGGTTQDSHEALKLYHHLKDCGFRPFYSEVEVGKRTGSDYEALILYALYTSECMLLVCSNENYLQTKWVKNEYTRFLSMIANEEKERDAITFVFGGKPIERLPGRSGKIQGIDLGKPDAYSRIERFVGEHTPEARSRRAAESAAKQRAAEEEKRRAEAEERRRFDEQMKVFEEQRRLLEEQRKAFEDQRKAYEEEQKQREAARSRQEKEEADARKQREEAAARAKEEQEALLREIAAQKEQVTAAAKPKKSGGKGENKGASGAPVGNLSPAELLAMMRQAEEEERVRKEEEKKAEEKRRQAEEKRRLEEEKRQKAEEKQRVAWTKANAPTVDCYDTKDYKIDGTTLVAVKGLKSDVIVPEGITEVKEIFKTSEQRHACKSITLPKSLKIIGNNAFSWTEIAEVTIPDGVTTIGPRAFCGCAKLKSVQIPDSVATIGREAFEKCTSLKEISLPASLKEFRASAFGGVKLESVTIKAGCGLMKWVRDDDYNSLLNPDAYFFTKKFVVEEGNPHYFAVSGGGLAERKRKKLVYGTGETVLPADGSIEIIGTHAYKFATGLHDFTVPSCIKKVETEAFYNCFGLTEITVEKGVMLASKAILYCQIIQMTIENGVKLSSHAIEGCSALVKVRIGETALAEAGESFLSGSPKLAPFEKIVDEKSEAERVRKAAEEKRRAEEEARRIAEEEAKAEAAAHKRFLEQFTIKDGVLVQFLFKRECWPVNLLPKAKKGVNVSYTVILPEEIEKIGARAFRDDGIREIVLHKGVTEIDAAAFTGCKNLRAIDVDAQNKAFTSVSGILYDKKKTKILHVPHDLRGTARIPDGVTEIPDETFFAPKLSGIALPKSLVSIGSRAFYCLWRENAISPSVAEGNPDFYAEGGCLIERKTKKLLLAADNCTIPEGVTEIGYAAFSGCRKTKELVIPSSVTAVDENAFRGTDGFEYVTMPKHLTGGILRPNLKRFFGEKAKSIKFKFTS